MLLNFLPVFLNDTSFGEDKPPVVDMRVVPGDVHQLKQQQQPLGTLRVERLRVKFTPCPHIRQCVQEVQALKERGGLGTLGC